MNIVMRPEGTLESLEQAMREHGLFVEGIKFEHVYHTGGDFVVKIGFFYGEHGRGTARSTCPSEHGMWMAIQGAIELAIEEKYRVSRGLPST